MWTAGAVKAVLRDVASKGCWAGTGGAEAERASAPGEEGLADDAVELLGHGVHARDAAAHAALALGVPAAAVLAAVEAFAALAAHGRVQQGAARAVAWAARNAVPAQVRLPSRHTRCSVHLSQSSALYSRASAVRHQQDRIEAQCPHSHTHAECIGSYWVHWSAEQAPSNISKIGMHQQSWHGARRSTLRMGRSTFPAESARASTCWFSGIVRAANRSLRPSGELFARPIPCDEFSHPSFCSSIPCSWHAAALPHSRRCYSFASKFKCSDFSVDGINESVGQRKSGGGQRLTVREGDLVVGESSAAQAACCWRVLKGEAPTNSCVAEARTGDP